MPTFKSSCVLFLLIAHVIVSGTALGDETDVTDSRSILTSTLDWVNKSNMTDDQKAKLRYPELFNELDSRSNKKIWKVFFK